MILKKKMGNRRLLRFRGRRLRLWRLPNVARIGRGMSLLRKEYQWIGDDLQFWEAGNVVEWRQQTGRLRHMILLVVVLEGEVFVSGVVCLVVFVVRIMQLHKIHDSHFFLVAGEVLDKMMEKCAHFEDGLHSMTCRRTDRQNLEGKENGQIFFHFERKGRGFGFMFGLYFFILIALTVGCTLCRFT